jgi:UDP-N-acetylglucosamine 2-epimerase
MQQLKVLTVVGTRPEVIKLSAVISALEESSAIEHVLVHTGQNYDHELNQVFFSDLRLRQPDYCLDAAGTSATETIAKVLVAIENVLREEAPDGLLILGDTDSCFAAVAAKKMRIPVFHVEAGNRGFDDQVPEETNRKVVDHLSDVNLCCSAIARDCLLREGFPPDRLITIGSPLKEVLLCNLESIRASNVLEHLGIDRYRYILVSTHRAENVDNKHRLTELVGALGTLADEFKLPVIVSTHPRTRSALDRLGLTPHDSIRWLKPFGFFDYVQLQLHAMVTLSDSGTISEESSILNFPALNIRRSHERPEAMEEAAVMMVGSSYERIRQGMEVLATQGRSHQRDIHPVDAYDVNNVASKVLRIIISYVDYIKRTSR